MRAASTLDGSLFYSLNGHLWHLSSASKSPYSAHRVFSVSRKCLMKSSGVALHGALSFFPLIYVFHSIRISSYGLLLRSFQMTGRNPLALLRHQGHRLSSASTLARMW